jgi:hypothetical protein
MLINFDENLRNELEYIISGKSKTGSEDLIETTSCYLRAGKGASKTAEQTKSTKVKETSRLEEFIEKNNLWYNTLDETKYIGEGAEQKVYLQKDGKTVVKLNESVYYLSWLDYLTSLQIHNVLFPDTKYSLLGFIKIAGKLSAVVEQPYVCTTTVTKLDDVKGYLSAKGFKNKKNNDYYHEEIGIILEYLHDENVLTNKGILFFIDTTFYIAKITS